MMYRVDVTNTGDYSFAVKSDRYEFEIDMKGESGITPPDTLLASIASCLGVYIRKYSEGAKLDIKDFSVSISAEFSKEPPARFKEIDVSIDLKGAALDDRRKKALLDFIKNCPVHNTLKNSPEVNIRLTA